MTATKNINEAIETFRLLDPKKIDEIAAKVKATIAQGNKLLVCGNGGSGSQADHFEAELIGRYLKSRRSLPCISLCQSASTTSCIVNDMGGQYIFSRPLEAHAKKGDVLFVLTTSGTSPNIMEALKKAKELGIFTIALLGKTGGTAKDIADLYYIVPSNNTARIQEAHIHIIHTICDSLEEFT